jgi:hypothetical protein
LTDTDHKSLIRSKLTKGVFVDSNILLLYLVGSHDEGLISRFKRTIQFTVEDFRLLQRLLPLFSRIITSPQVLTEVNSLLNQLTDPARTLALRQLGSFVQIADERFVAAIDTISHPGFEKFGLADTATWILASEGPLVLTDDFRLSQTLEAAGVASINFNHIRILVW